MGARAGSDPSLSLHESGGMMVLEGLGGEWNCSMGAMQTAVCGRAVVPAHVWLRDAAGTDGAGRLCSACVVAAGSGGWWGQPWVRL